MNDQTASENYENKISQCDWTNLLQLWQSIKAGDTPGWASGKVFEYLILRAFQLDGAAVRWPFNVQMDGEIEQLDGVIYTDGLSCVVECKDTTALVNVEPLAKLRNQLLRRPVAAIGLLFSQSGFTSSALTLSQYVAPQTILLWKGEDIAFALENKCFRRVLVTKYRHCIEHGLQYYQIRTEEDLL